MIVHQPHNSLGNYSYNAFFYDDCEWFYHFHKNYELIYVLEGAVELTLGGQTFLLQADTFAIVLPNQFHAYRTPDHSRVWIAVFSADFVGEFAKLTEGKEALDPRFSCEKRVKDYLLSGLITEATPELLSMKSLLYAACGEFLRQVQLQDMGAEQDLVQKMTGYLSAHFQEELRFAQLADFLGYEYHYLSRQFHRHFNMHFKQVLNLYRVDYARQQLLFSDDSITNIAYSAGFQTVRSFNRVFTEHNGMSPSRFRKTSPRLRQQRQNADGTFYYSYDEA